MTTSKCVTTVTYTAAGREYTTRLDGKHSIESAEKALNEAIESGPERIVSRVEVMGIEGARIGRPPLHDTDLTERRTVTLPRSQWAAIDAAGSNRSATLARIVAEWIAKKGKKNG